MDRYSATHSSAAPLTRRRGACDHPANARGSAKRRFQRGTFVSSEAWETRQDDPEVAPRNRILGRFLRRFNARSSRRRRARARPPISLSGPLAYATRVGATGSSRRPPTIGHRQPRFRYKNQPSFRSPSTRLASGDRGRRIGSATFSPSRIAASVDLVDRGGISGCRQPKPAPGDESHLPASMSSSAPSMLCARHLVHQRHAGARDRPLHKMRAITLSGGLSPWFTRSASFGLM